MPVFVERDEDEDHQRVYSLYLAIVSGARLSRGIDIDTYRKLSHGRIKITHSRNDG